MCVCVCVCARACVRACACVYGLGNKVEHWSCLPDVFKKNVFDERQVPVGVVKELLCESLTPTVIVTVTFQMVFNHKGELGERKDCQRFPITHTHKKKL